MPPTTQPVDPSAPKPANILTIQPTVTDHETGAVYVHQDYVRDIPNWEVVEHIAPISTTEKLGDIDSWAAYVERFAGGDVDVSAPLLTWSERGLTAIIDYHHADGTPQRCAWIARHDFVKSHQWNVWTMLANGQGRGQKLVLEALEDNQADIVDPSPAQLLAVLRTLRATSSATADTELLADGSTKVVWQKQTGVKSAEIELPPEFRIAIPVLKGHNEPTEEGKNRPVVYSMAVRIRASVDDQAKLSLRLSIPDSERVLEAVFADRVAAAQALLGADRRLYRGAAER